MIERAGTKNYLRGRQFVFELAPNEDLRSAGDCDSKYWNLFVPDKAIIVALFPGHQVFTTALDHSHGNRNSGGDSERHLPVSPPNGKHELLIRYVLAILEIYIIMFNRFIGPNFMIFKKVESIDLEINTTKAFISRTVKYVYLNNRSFIAVIGKERS